MQQLPTYGEQTMLGVVVCVGSGVQWMYQLPKKCSNMQEWNRVQDACYIQCTTTGSSDITNYTVLNGDLHALYTPNYKTEMSKQIQWHALTNNWDVVESLPSLGLQDQCIVTDEQQYITNKWAEHLENIKIWFK